MRTILASLVLLLPIVCWSQDSECELERPEAVRAHLDRIAKIEIQRLELVEGAREELSTRQSPTRRQKLLKLLAEAEGPLAEAVRKERERLWCPSESEETIAYMIEIQRRIEDCGTRNFPAKNGKKLYGAPRLEFAIDLSGALISSKVTKTSKIPALDAHAMRMIEASAPFGSLPNEITRASFNRIRLSSSFRFVREAESVHIDAPVRQCSY